MSIGAGAVFPGVQAAANAGVPPDKAGLAASLVNASFQLGGAPGLAIFPAIATARTSHPLASHASLPDALTPGFHRALPAASIFPAAAALTALPAATTRGEPDPDAAPEPVPVLHDVT